MPHNNLTCPKCLGKRFLATPDPGKLVCHNCGHCLEEARGSYATRFDGYVDEDFFKTDPFSVEPEGNGFLRVKKFGSQNGIPVLVTVEPIFPHNERPAEDPIDREPLEAAVTSNSEGK